MNQRSLRHDTVEAVDELARLGATCSRLVSPQDMPVTVTMPARSDSGPHWQAASCHSEPEPEPRNWDNVDTKFVDPNLGPLVSDAKGRGRRIEFK